MWEFVQQIAENHPGVLSWVVFAGMFYGKILISTMLAALVFAAAVVLEELRLSTPAVTEPLIFVFTPSLLVHVFIPEPQIAYIGSLAVLALVAILYGSEVLTRPYKKQRPLQ